MSFLVYALNLVAENWGDDADDFQVVFHCELEQSGTPGGEAFVVNVTSLKRLSRWLRDGQERVVHGRGCLFVDDYDVHAIRHFLQQLIEQSGTTNWEQLHRYIEKYYDWI